MFYLAELHFLQKIFQKCHLQSLLLSPDSLPGAPFDLGLRKQLRMEQDYSQLLHDLIKQIKPNTIYKLTDQFLCSYLFLQLPDTASLSIFSVGPYLAVEATHEELLEQAEQSGVHPQQFHLLESYYSSLPVLTDESLLFAPIDTFCELIWQGTDTFSMVDVNQKLSDDCSPFPLGPEDGPQKDTIQNMQTMEARYAYENEMMQAVAQGLTHKAERMLPTFSQISFERRLADPIRNLKNYGIIMNTLLRKAAESGGVHPLHLDRISSDFARKIEAVSSITAGQNLMIEMFRSYCRLVKRHSTKHYSPPVQKAIVQIDSDLSADLSLKTLADMQSINASYLSSLFKKETGKTVTDYVNQKRIRLALQLLSATKLQIQTIAQHCGIPDVNYFSKMFKKYTEKTPKEYRKQIHLQLSAKKAP